MFGNQGHFVRVTGFIVVSVLSGQRLAVAVAHLAVAHLASATFVQVPHPPHRVLTQCYLRCSCSSCIQDAMRTSMVEGVANVHLT